MAKKPTNENAAFEDLGKFVLKLTEWKQRLTEISLKNRIVLGGPLFSFLEFPDPEPALTIARQLNIPVDHGRIVFIIESIEDFDHAAAQLNELTLRLAEYITDNT